MRTLQKYIESPLSKQILAGDFKTGATVLVEMDSEGKEIVFKESKSKKAPAKKEEQEVDA
jgi:ATP-dependent Clp protease ATP-binding subunit ClpA